MENIKKVNLTEQEAIAEIMSIIGDSPIKEDTLNSAPELEILNEKPQSITYDGYGNKIEINGKKIAKGYTKGAKKVRQPKDSYRDDLTNAIEVILNRVAAFEGKVGRNKIEGVVIRMEDADYTIKVNGHTTCEYDCADPTFKCEKNYATRGKTVNHSSSIAKVLVSCIEDNIIEIQNLKPNSKMFLCLVKASGIRFQIDQEEFTIKISKKRARVVLS